MTLTVTQWLGLASVVVATLPVALIGVLLREPAAPVRSDDAPTSADARQ